MSEEEPFAAVNAAKQIAWQHCSEAVEFLVAVMNDPEMDTDWRITAAAELLTFALKGPN